MQVDDSSETVIPVKKIDSSETSSWIYENLLSEIMSTLTKILLKRAFNSSNRPESNEQDRKEVK